MGYKAVQFKRQLVADKSIIGIDPVKSKHKAAVLNSSGIKIGNDFSFKSSHDRTRDIFGAAAGWGHLS